MVIKRIEQTDISKITNKILIEQDDLISELFDHIAGTKERKELNQLITDELDKLDRSKIPNQERRDHHETVIEYAIYVRFMQDWLDSASHYYITDQDSYPEKKD